MKSLADRRRNSYTLIEILVVVTIIGLIAAISTVSYTILSKQSRDATRKADLEQVRSAIEMYRSNNASGLYPTGFTMPCNSVVAINDATNTYLSRIPQDPKCSTSIPTYNYYYSSDGLDYTIAAYLERTSSCLVPMGADSCGTGKACNYCLGPYGQK